MNNEILQNLFTLEWMRSEYSYSKHLKMKLRNVKFDEYYYDFVIQSANFKMFKELIFIENEYCMDFLDEVLGDYSAIANTIINFKSESK